MNRQRASQLRLSRLHLQQGLFGVLALVITLFGAQQFLSWELSRQQEGPSVTFQQPIQTHFSAARSTLIDGTSLRMMDVDEHQVSDQSPRQERWVF